MKFRVYTPSLILRERGRGFQKGGLAKNPWYARANALTLTLSLKIKGEGVKNLCVVV
jgi:hypothetical protein